MHQSHSVLDEIRRLGDDRESGKLALSNGKERVEIFYREGMIDAVSSNLDLHRLGQYLVKEGWLQSKDLDALLSESRRNNMLFGETAIWKKFLEPTELSEVVRHQA